MNLLEKISSFSFKKFIFYSTYFLCVFSLIFRFQNFDNDLWARLIQGAHVFEFFKPISNDFYSFCSTHIWYDPEWLSSAFIYLIQDKFGLLGLILLNALAFYLLFCLIIFILKKQNIKNEPYNLFYFSYISLIVAFFGVNQAVIRCQIFTFILFAIWIYLLEEIRKGKYKYSIFLPFVMLFWLNTHGGCIAGIGILILYIIGEFLNKKPIKYFLVALVFSCFVFLFNPWGLDYIKFILNSAIIDRSYIFEWRSAFETWLFLNPYLYFLFFAIFSYFVQIFKKKENFSKLDKTKLILIFTLSYLSISHIKHVFLAVILFSIFLYDDMMETFKIIFGKISKNILKIINIIFYFLIFSYSSLVLLAFSFDESFQKRLFTQYPIEAMEFLKNNDYQGNLLTNFSFGSFIAYKYYPNFKIFIDGRQEQVYSKETVNEFNDFDLSKNPEFILNKYSPDFVMLSLNVSPNLTLMNNKNYFPIYSDKKVNIYALNKHKKKKYVKVQIDKEKYLKEIFKTNIKFKRVSSK